MAMPDLFISTSARDKASVEFLNTLFHDAAQRKVSDVQLRFIDHSKMIRVESVGTEVLPLEPWAEIVDQDMYENIDARLRSRAHIDASARRSAQDGKIRLIYRGQRWGGDLTLDIRVSIIPTDAGQTYVCRILDAASSLMPLEAIAMSAPVRRVLKSLLLEKQGIVVVCGPTGSGKTTLLFSILQEFKKLRKNIKTIEHPCEYIVSGIDQVAMTRDLSFADALRAFMRQRPHVILVGEVRDEETAQIVFQAGNTGHIVFCTTHSDDSARVISRFVDLGIDRESIAASVKMVIAQRLINSIPSDSPNAKMPAPASDYFKYWLRSAGAYRPNDLFVQVPEDAYTGKLPLFELIRVTPEVRTAICQPSSSASDVFAAASLQPQFETLTQNAVRLAREGRTTLMAVRSTVGESIIPVASERIDHLLMDENLLEPKDAFAAIERQAALANEGEILPLWEVLIELGLVQLEQVIDVIGKTRSARLRASYFLENDQISSEQFDSIATEWLNSKRSQSLFSLLIQHCNLSTEDVYDKALLYYLTAGLAPLY